MARGNLDREDSKTAIPQLSAKLNQILDDNVIFNKQMVTLTQQAEQNNQDFAYFRHLTAGYIEAIAGDFQYLSSHEAYFDHVTAEILDSTEINTQFMQADFANIKHASLDVAEIGVLFNEVGLIDSATIVDGHVTGYLDAVQIDAANITAGTIVTNRLLLSGTATGNTSILYELNNLGQLTSQNVDSLDGYVLTPRTINADRIVAGAITANECNVQSLTASIVTATNIIALDLSTYDLSAWNATIGGFHIGQSSLYSGSKSSIGSPYRGIYLGSSGEMNIGSATKYVKFWNDNGTDKLEIYADKFVMGSAPVLTDVDVTVTQTSTGAEITVNTQTANIYNGQDGQDGQDGVDGQDGADGKSISQLTTINRSQPWATIQSWVGLINDTWGNVTAYTGQVGDTVLIPIEVTDKDNQIGYMRCVVKGYSGTTLTTDNLDFMFGPTGPPGADTSSRYFQYQTFDGTNGLRVYAGDKDDTTYNKNYVQIKGSGITLVRNNNTLATFGDSVELISRDTIFRGTRKARLSGDGLFLNDGTNDLAGFGFVNKSNGYPDGGYIELGKNAKIYVQSNTGHQPGGQTTDEGAIDFYTSGGLGVIMHTDMSVAFRNTPGTFAVTEESITVGGSSDTGAKEGTKSLTKTGYYPIGIVGFSVVTTNAYSRGCYLTDVTNGSCTLRARLWIASASSGGKACTAYVLWVRDDSV